MPTTPKNPESLASLQARYPAALEPIYDATAIMAGAIRPGEIAANIFDFSDGLRLIISRDRLPDGQVVLHVSASQAEHSRMADELRLLAGVKPKREVIQTWLLDLPRRFRELSGDQRPLEFIGLSDRLIPHFFIREHKE
jgi:hypothetical protein